MPRLSIRQRMLVCLVALLVPICVFVGLLIKEVNKTIHFAEKEIAGVTVQQHLLEMLAALQAGRNQKALGDVEPATVQRLVAAQAAFQAALKDHGSEVGLGAEAMAPGAVKGFGLAVFPAEWQAAVDVLNKEVSSLTTGDANAWAEAEKVAIAASAIITRVSDGSGLTLDPDMDSYYLMDTASFAMPDVVNHLAGTQALMQELATDKKSTSNPHTLAALILAKHAMEDDEGQRVLNSLDTALAEDAKHYGTSATLGRLQGMAVTFKSNLDDLVAMMKTTVDTGRADLETTLKAFEQMNAGVAALTKAAQEELIVLLQNRINNYSAYRTELLVEGGVAVLAGILLFFFVARSIVVPLAKIRAAMVDLAGGKIDLEVPCTQLKDELGQMAGTLLVFKENANFLRSVSNEFEASVLHAVERVAAVASEIGVAARDLTTQAGQGHVRLADLCKDIEYVSGGSKEIAAAGEQLKAAINEISAQVSVSAETTSQAAQEAEHVRQTALLLEEATDKISNVVTIISSITNKIALLALNATIESARAGEAGKGFAVVASEVKTLARQTEESTSEIAQAVAAIQQSSKQTLGAIQSIGEIIKRLSEGSTVIAAAVEEQGAVADNIAQNMAGTTVKLENVAAAANDLIELTANSSAAATQSMQASIEFAGQFDKLRGEVREFVGTMRGEKEAA